MKELCKECSEMVDQAIKNTLEKYRLPLSIHTSIKIEYTRLKNEKAKIMLKQIENLRKDFANLPEIKPIGGKKNDRR